MSRIWTRVDLKSYFCFWEISPIFSVGFDFSRPPDAKTTSERIVVFFSAFIRCGHAQEALWEIIALCSQLLFRKI